MLGAWGSASRVDPRPLVEGAGEWSRYLRRVATTGRDHFALIEFVRDETAEQFLADAETLKAGLAGFL